jgi:TolB-like protein/Tfp pilus assembly protein PilF
MSPPPAAVFVSYASQDSEAAERLCGALRAGGVEVWFDRSDLAGGDAWDRKIRRQLADCALFIPLISANTEARLEGYFRREWRQAAARTHDMAEEKAFLLPVVIDDTRDAGARVPPEFKGVQWTRLPGGESTPGFVTRVQRLLAGAVSDDRSAAPYAAMGAVLPAPGPEASVRAPSAAPALSPRIIIAAAGALLLAGGAAYWLTRPAKTATTGMTALADSAGRSAASASATTTDDSVAVLAFANLSEETDNEYFSEGISEELINVLARIPDLKVTARTSAFSFKGKDIPIPEIARQLGVAYIVEGSVRRSGDKVRITAQLVKAADGFQAWNGTFTRELKDIFAVQAEIAGLVAANISSQLSQATAGTTRQVDPEAFRLYLEGRALATRAGIDNLKQAIVLFERSLARDPGFTLARSQEARAYVQLGRWGGMVPKEAWAAAKAALAPALAAEPDAPEVLVAQGWLLRTADWKWHEAERTFASALAQRPNDTDTLVSAAVLKAGLGRSEEAHTLAGRALELDPLNPATQLDLGLIYRFSGRFVDAESRFRRALELSPDGQRYRGFLGITLVELGRFDEAERIARDEPDLLTRLFVQGLVAAGRGDQRRLREVIAETRSKSSSLEQLGDYPAYVGAMLAAAGDLDMAMRQVEQMRDTRDPGIGWMKVNYLFRPLHSHPRWSAFMRSVGLSDEQLAEPPK